MWTSLIILWIPYPIEEELIIVLKIIVRLPAWRYGQPNKWVTLLFGPFISWDEWIHISIYKDKDNGDDWGMKLSSTSKELSQW